ncbi:hypothetical protein LV457_05265 [Mycobacterium sp. MYCO198283]|uniref:type VII secretion target n=1 Tax=Mycobacterium sp. MYCO198283 TaxID=2883505 RepID=UPI001E2B28AA|nr:type VII secretion target [Mycobacterium sp. MYCO198283]MCG5431701.1 hypothetical protein [Mycobacterium sp. MYCO198283]
MHADTDAIRGFGARTTVLAEDMRAAASPLADLRLDASVSAFGPVGARFLGALHAAAGSVAARMTAIGDDLDRSGRLVEAAAVAFDATEARSRAHLGALG